MRIVRRGFLKPLACPECGLNDVQRCDVADRGFEVAGFQCLKCGCQWVVEDDPGGNHVVRERS